MEALPLRVDSDAELATHDSALVNLACAAGLPGAKRTHVAFCLAMLDAWARGQELTVHGWIYDLGDGLLRELQSPISTFTSSGSIPGAAEPDRQPQ